jgi:hypothetical protein
MDERARPQEKHRLGACGRTRGCERQYGVVGVTPNRHRGRLRSPPLPHHRTYGSVYGGSVILALTGWKFETPSANVGFTAHLLPAHARCDRNRRAVQFRISGSLG